MSIDELLQEIITRPRDLSLRRAFADAVAAEQPLRAEMIRLQVARAEAGGGPLAWRDPTAWHDAWHRGRILLRKPEVNVYERDVAGLATRLVRGAGFPERAVFATADLLRRNLATLRERAPILDVAVRDASGQAQMLARCEALDGLRSLNLKRAGLDDEGLIALVGSPFLSSFTWLDLSDNCIGSTGLEALAGADTLPGLQWLGFARNLAPDPTPEIAEDEGIVHWVALRGEALEAKFGPKAWLGEPKFERWCPPPSWF